MSTAYCTEKHQWLHIQHGMDHEGAGILKQIYMLFLNTNPNHPIMETLQQNTMEDENEKAVKNLEVLLFATALLSSSFSLKDLKAHCHGIYYMIKLGLGTEEGEVPAEEPSTAIPDEILSLEGNKDTQDMEEVD